MFLFFVVRCLHYCPSIVCTVQIFYNANDLKSHFTDHSNAFRFRIWTELNWTRVELTAGIQVSVLVPYHCQAAHGVNCLLSGGLVDYLTDGQPIVSVSGSLLDLCVLQLWYYAASAA